MKVVTIVGTRPELIRLHLIIKACDNYFDHCFVHTGQNFTPSLHDQFFEDLQLRKPDHQFNFNSAAGISFVAQMLIDIESVVVSEKPDVGLILGDTNSALAAYVLKKHGVPVVHMEAGNRCYDPRVPEELNRKVVDSCSDLLLTYTQRSREQLLLEGYPADKVVVVGNPIGEVVRNLKNNGRIANTMPDGGQLPSRYYLSTIHRSENVESKSVLTGMLEALAEVAHDAPLLLSNHPKMADMIRKHNIEVPSNIRLVSPPPLSVFLGLMENASLVLTDSGTVPEECCLLGTPCVLMRDSTERPELLENNSMVVAGTKRASIVTAAKIAIGTQTGSIPSEYTDDAVSENVVKLILKSAHANQRGAYQ